jgi:NitT/TauT family transport system substrate-binding protein
MKKRIRQILIPVATSVALVLSVSACSSSSGGSDGGTAAPKSDRLVLAVAGTAPVAYTGYIEAGEENGIFKKHGIDLDVQYIAGGTAVVSALQTGQADIGVSGPEPGYIADANSGGTIVSIYQSAYSSIYAYGFLSGSPIQTPDQMKGAKVGVVSQSGSATPFLTAELKKHGLSINDVTLVPIGEGASAAAAVQSKRVNVLFYDDSGFATLKHSGFKVKQLPIPGVANNYPGQVVMTTQKTLKARKAVLRRFDAAYSEAIKACLKNGSACMTDFAKWAPEASAGHELDMLSWNARAKILLPPKDAKGVYGFSADRYWNEVGTILTAGGVITKAPDPSDVYTNELLK